MKSTLLLYVTYEIKQKHRVKERMRMKNNSRRIFENKYNQIVE
jgi:hypothetical protein